MSDIREDHEFFTIDLDWSRWWTLLPEIVVLICSGLLPLITAASVVARYTNWYHVIWAQDVVKVLFLWIVFLGGAVAVKYNAHVRMSTLSDRLEQAFAAASLWSWVIRLSPITVGGILLVLGVPLVRITMQRELPTLQISAGYFSAVVPLSGALMIYYVLRGAIARLRQKPTGGPPQAD